MHRLKIQGMLIKHNVSAIVTITASGHQDLGDTSADFIVIFSMVLFYI
jgi:hypothetical protein